MVTTRRRTKVPIILVVSFLLAVILSVGQIAVYIAFEVNEWSPISLKAVTWNMLVTVELMFRKVLPAPNGHHLEAFAGLGYAVVFGATVNWIGIAGFWFLADRRFRSVIDN